jgi:hypothetical protein
LPTQAATMARRDVCARSAEASAVAEDMLLRLAIAAYARHAQSGPALDSQLSLPPTQILG